MEQNHGLGWFLVIFLSCLFPGLPPGFSPGQLLARGEGPGPGDEEDLWPENDECLICHGRTKLKRETSGESVHVDKKVLGDSIHARLACVQCHADLKEKDLPHENKLARVSCGGCHYHAKIGKSYRMSMHGQEVARGNQKAPRCQDCHGGHDIGRVRHSGSAVAKFRIPLLCGKCHEGRQELIHARDFQEKGLLVTATCDSCHPAHEVLPGTDPKSSIAPARVNATCSGCHGQFREVHREFIQFDLWEKEGQAIPVCVNCHQPHRDRKVFYDQGLASADCIRCHGEEDIRAGDGRSLHVDAGELARSRHAGIPCSQCHWGVKPSGDRPCATITQKVNCSACHARAGDEFRESTHGRLLAENDPDAPSCQDCHGTHGILGREDRSSPTYPLRVPDLCARCHRDGEPEAKRLTVEKPGIPSHYTESIHGRGLREGGLVVAASCTSCHRAHRVLPGSDERSSVHPENLSATCGGCHVGIQEIFDGSIHSSKILQTARELPSCGHCHAAHPDPEREGFRLEILNTCGKCHPEVTRAYLETFHGKAALLGSAGAAKCHDCHGAHDILPLPALDHRSRLHPNNILETCRKCHPGATRGFTQYIPHANPAVAGGNRWLFAAYWGMTALLVGTFTVFGLHLLLWLPRSIQMRRSLSRQPSAPGEKQFLRFTALDRTLHVLMILSFISLALTGLIRKFSYTGWAATLSRFLGGFDAAGNLHRAAAMLMFCIYVIHLVDVVRRKRRSRASWREMLTGPNTLIPRKKDVSDFWATIRWFLGRGERPRYGRWAYWEKFDYLAAFWGITVIGATGLLIWFSEFFTRFLPGWILNVAAIIHGDEALLAVGFIFTIHFFNNHLRPEKFPMDVKIFTGRVPLEEFKRDKPLDYEALERSGELEKRLSDSPGPEMVLAIRIFAWAALAAGLGMVVWIIYAMLFA